MSYDHPSGDFNSAGENPDPMSAIRIERAEARIQEYERTKRSIWDYNPFGSWKRFTEDIIHFTPMDELPQEDQDAIRLRRRKNFEGSSVPWIVSDYTGLLTAIDDVDDLMKTKKLVSDYALTPAAKAARNLRKGDKPWLDSVLDGWREGCDVPAPPREKKLLIPSFAGLNFLAQLLTGAFCTLLPLPRLACLLMQAAQTTDALFGIGLQLGPVLGFLMEAKLRALEAIGGPIFHFDNKWEQLKAARILQKTPYHLAAAAYADSDDALSSLTGFYWATDHARAPIFVISPEDYPSIAEVFEDPSTFGKEALDFGRLAASLPYNMGAAALNVTVGEGLTNMATALSWEKNPYPGQNKPDNATRALMKIAENGICPGGQCEGETAMDALLLATQTGYRGLGTGAPVTQQDLARNLGLKVQDPFTLYEDEISREQ
jgi:hypothetical protein